MKGLWKYLSPFSPDQSGASAVLYGLGGIVLVCDAGGCAGNICGFDEPRWFKQKSAVFSAGLRDMDAILGRDDRLVDKFGPSREALTSWHLLSPMWKPILQPLSAHLYRPLLLQIITAYGV